MKNKVYNPLFLFSKRKAIVSRIKEVPGNLLWRFLSILLKKGFLYHPDYQSLEAIKDIHKGKKCVLIGNGPSVKLGELELLKGNKNIVTFCANRFHLCFEQTDFRPEYLVSSDEQMIRDFGEEMVSSDVNHVFLSDLYKPDCLKIKTDGKATWVKLFHGRPFRFSKNIEEGAMAGGGTLIMALQIGYKMGIRDFYLYGVDHSFEFKNHGDGSNNDAIGDGNHFIKNYRSAKAWQSPRMELVEEAFMKSDMILRKEGGALKNATNGGKLEVLERVDFGSLVS